MCSICCGKRNNENDQMEAAYLDSTFRDSKTIDFDFGESEDSFTDLPDSKSPAEDESSETKPHTPYEYRKRLPVVAVGGNVSVWAILRNAIGKELSKISMPVGLNEPLSFTQRVTEPIEYSYLLDKAVLEENAVERMEDIVAFIVSGMASNFQRLGKPFNPLLGETYEYVRQDKGIRFLSEQVSHHPPITAFCADGHGYRYVGSVNPKIKFWGKTVEVTNKGIMRIYLKKFKEVYTWETCSYVIHNIIMGTMWLEQKGTINITMEGGFLQATLTFSAAPFGNKQPYFVEGFIYEGSQKVRALYGCWAQCLFSCPVEEYEDFLSSATAKANYKQKEKRKLSNTKVASFNLELPRQKTLWEVIDPLKDKHKYYHMTSFSITLNEMVPGMEEYLPKTDSRFRPDVRALEEGRMDEADLKKAKLEEKQRANKGLPTPPRWFGMRKPDEWCFKGKYWDRDYTNCPDIFSV